MIINNNIAKQRRQILKQRRALVRDDILEQGYNDAESSLAVDMNQKKRKMLNRREFKSLDRSEQLEKLTEF